MSVRGMVFDVDPRRPWLAERSARSLRSAGIVEVVKVAALDEAPQDGPSLCLRAGAWFDDTRKFEPVPPSATGRELIAIGSVVRGEASEAWEMARAECGGDFSGGALPEIFAAWGNPRLLGGQENPRVIHWQKLDVHTDGGLRVIQVVTSLQHGGAERIAWELHRLLPSCRVDSCIVTLGRPLRRTLPEPGNWIDLAGMNREDRAAEMEKIAAWFGADLIHAHLIDADEARAFASCGLPLVMTIHNTRRGWPEGLATLQRDDAALLIACTSDAEHELNMTLPQVPTRIVWNGIDGSQFTSSERAAADNVTLIVVANPRPQKRLHLLPAILAATRRELQRCGAAREVKLIIVGEPSERSSSSLDCVTQVRSAAVHHDVAAFIEWTHGEVETCDALARADILVCTSLHEGMSLAHLEALAAGLPVVTTHVSGAQEMSWHNDALHILPVDAAPEDFARIIVQVIERKPVQGRAVVLRDFTAELMTRRCAWAYESLMTLRACREAQITSVWFITNNLSTGGAQSSLRRLVKAFREDGIPVRVALLQEYPEHPTAGREDLIADGVPVLVLAPAGTMDATDAVRQLLGEMRASPAQSVVFWNAIPVYKMLIADALRGVPVFDVSPGEMYFDSLERYFQNPRPALPYRTPREYGSLLAGVIVKYEAEARRAAEFIGAPVHVIPNGVSCAALPPERTSSAVLRIGTAARISPQKRLEDLIAAFQIALPDLPPCVLRIAGGVETGCDEYAASLRQSAEGLPVEWAGELRDVSAFHAALDLFAMISEPAGCPNASLEAMASGLTVIATDVGGASEQVRDGVNGRLVSARDPKAFAAALVELACDAKKRVRMGGAGRQHVEENFSLGAMLSGYRRTVTTFRRDADATQAG